MGISAHGTLLHALRFEDTETDRTARNCYHVDNKALTPKGEKAEKGARGVELARQAGAE